MYFNIYYMNFPKAYEIKMIINNLIQTSKNIEVDNNDSTDAELKASMGAKFLGIFNADVGAKTNLASADSQKIVEAFEVKSTKSTVLSDVIQNCITPNNINDVKEGQLLRIDDVRLGLINELELRAVKLASSGAFKDAPFMKFEGVDLSNALNSMLKDYAYKIKGITRNDAPLLMKIPMTFESEFESLYSIDDLFVGRVTLVGIYKGKLKMTALKNSFDFFQELNGGNITTTEHEVRNSQTRQSQTLEVGSMYEDDGIDYHFIDLLAIVQAIELSNDKS